MTNDLHIIIIRDRKKIDKREDDKMEEGTKFILPVFGIRVEGERLKALIEDEMANREDDNSELANLHEDWSGLDGWFMGNRDNPEGLIVGVPIYHDTETYDYGSHMPLENPFFDFKRMQSAVDECERHAAEFNYDIAIKEFIGEGYEEKEMKWYMVYTDLKRKDK